MKDTTGFWLFAIAAWSGVVVGILGLLSILDVGVEHHPGSNIEITASTNELLVLLAIFFPLAIIFTVVAVRVSSASKVTKLKDTPKNSITYKSEDKK